MATALKASRKAKQTLAKVRPAADGFLIHIPARAFTLAGFRAWVKSDEFPEKLRCAFIDQEIYLDMSKEELETHAKVKAEVCRVLMNLNHDQKLGDFYLDGILITNEAADVSNNPDATLLRFDSIESERVHLVPGKKEEGQFIEVEGTPDWVLEIVSASSVRKDTEKLRAAYHRAGIPEYWLIDARGEEIVFQILHRRKTGYAAAPNKGGWQRSRVFGRAFRLVRERDRLGMWEYTLEVRST